jgi:probable addiction module antidote protein
LSKKGRKTMTTTHRTAAKATAPSIKAFDLSDYLDSEDMQTEYLNQVLLDGDAAEFTRAVGHIARARGMAQLARDTGLGRESLYKALSADAKPRFETVFKVMQALGLQLQTTPVASAG